MLNVVAEYDKGNRHYSPESQNGNPHLYRPKGFSGATNADLAYQNMSLMAETLGVSQFYEFPLFCHQIEKGSWNNLGIRGRFMQLALGIPKVKFNNCNGKTSRFEFI